MPGLCLYWCSCIVSFACILHLSADWCLDQEVIMLLTMVDFSVGFLRSFAEFISSSVPMAILGCAVFYLVVCFIRRFR